MSRLLRTLLGCAIILIALPTLASGAPALKGTLKPDSCDTWAFTGGGVFNGSVTHSNKTGDIVQIVCEPGGERCWAFSFSNGEGGVALTAGLAGFNNWELFICALATNKGKTKYQAAASFEAAASAAGPGLGDVQFSSAPVTVDLASDAAPAGVKDWMRRLETLAGR